MNRRFIAMDFETAGYSRNSACAVGIVLVDNLVITDQFYTLIRPPVNDFRFTWLHGISWNDVKDKPAFDELWPEISGYFDGIDFAVAHNAPFDRSVLRACCAFYGIDEPGVDFECTLRIARKRLALSSNKLDRVSAHFGIELDHHNALSDSLACAKIMMNFLK
jgi:DNA polymerase-3 subunit epsilon